MSGIFGIHSRRGEPVEASRLSVMQQAMAHRGPDGCQDLIGPGIALGHLSLLTDPDRRAPGRVVQEVAGLWYTGDARLDNRRDLERRLGTRPVDDQRLTDAELILCAYRRWGSACAGQLLGDFAFVIFDAHRQTLLCARDQIGIRPLYYHLNEDVVLFASEAQAVARAMSPYPSPDASRIADFLMGLEPIGLESTFYEGVKRLPPAHTLEVSTAGTRLTRYWSPEAHGPAERRTPADLREELSALLSAAIGCRQVSGARTPCMISGGIDSAAVALFAPGPDPIVAYSATRSAPGCEDTRLARRLAALASLPKREITLEGFDVEDEGLKAAFASLDDPFAATLTLPMAIYLAAARDGHRVVLDGVEGDQVFSLPAAYPVSLMKQGRWISGVRELWGQIEQQRRIQFFPSLLWALGATLMPGAVRRLHADWTADRRVQEQLEDSLLAAELRNSPRIHDHYRRWRLRQRTARTGLDGQHVEALLAPSIPVALERYDRAAALCGVEPRHPLLDRRIVEFCLALPWRSKVYRGCSKFLLRQAVAHAGAGEIAWRKDKPHLGWQFSEAWMAHHWHRFSSRVRMTRPLWNGYAAEEDLLALFAQPAYDVDEPTSDPWFANALAQWLTKWQADSRGNPR